jgi:tyrosine-protein kinase Etk/Wzc
MSQEINSNNIQDMAPEIEQGNSFDLRSFIGQIISYLPWIILSLILSFVLAKLFLRYKQPTYNVEAKLLIRDEKRADAGESEILKQLGTGNGGFSMDNEIEILTSRTLMQKVVDSLNLNVYIQQEGRVKKSITYGVGSLLVLPYY